jgi:hypothetical protein
MPMKRLRAPRDVTCLAVAEHSFTVKDGYIEVPEEYEATARMHGFGKEPEKVNLDRLAKDNAGVRSEEDVAAMNRGDLLAYCDDQNLDVKPRMSLDDLRALVWKHAKAQKKLLDAAKG